MDSTEFINIFFKKLRFIEEVGKGSYGRVYKIFDKKDLKFYALKEVSILSKDTVKYVINEELPIFTHHKNILSYNGLFLTRRPKKLESIATNLDMESLAPEVCNNDICQELKKLKSTLYTSRRVYSDESLSNSNQNTKYYFYLKTTFCEFTLREFIDFRNWVVFDKDLNAEISRCNPSIEYMLFRNNYGTIKNMPVSIYLYSTNSTDRSVVNRHFMRYIFKQIISGLIFLHAHGISHNDIKPSNIFFEKRGLYVPKIGDFGLIKKFHAKPRTSLSKRQKQPKGISRDLKAASLMYFEMLQPVKTGMERYYNKKNLLMGLVPEEFQTDCHAELGIIKLCIDLPKKCHVSAKTVFSLPCNLKIN